MVVRRVRTLAAVLSAYLALALGCGDWAALGNEPGEDGSPCCHLDTAELQAEREDYSLEWCPGACAEAYRQGWMQGLACESDEAEYSSSVRAYQYDTFPDEITCCYPLIVSGVGCNGDSHFDGVATAFDYGLFDGWTAAECEGEPRGTDMGDLTWPDRDPDDDTPGHYQAGWYPCPDPA